MELVADACDGTLLGVHALAAAGELMLAATYAITAHRTGDDLAETSASIS